jgi:hypothetical protein
MTYLRTMLLAAAASGALCASASALPLSGAVPGQDASLLQNAALVCNARGRCWETGRHIYRDYDEDVYVGPRYRYYEERPGVGFRFGDRWR